MITATAAMSFEEALAELEKIVQRLESGSAPLEESISIYERGAALKGHCEARLEQARLRVEKVVLSQGCERRRAGRLHVSLARRIAETADVVTVALDELLPRADGPETRLMEAMRYAALGPGKRLRPFFAIETGKMFDLPERPVLRAACALECIHAYSLVHDDLPAMDDDDVRRGRPTVHKQYDEATAILAGDALQTAAFEIMAHPDTHPDGNVRAELVRKLALPPAPRAWPAAR
jgi:exodeoxyribonuclease VII small subunit